MLVDLLPRSDRTALVDASSGTSLSFSALTRDVELVAEALASWQGGLAFVYTSNTLPDVLAYLGCARAGIAVALLDAQLDGERRLALEVAYRPDLVIGDDPGGDTTWVDVPMPAATPVVRARAHGEPKPLPAELALCLSTSGSTGSPKFVRLTHGNLSSNARSIVDALSITDGEVALAHLPIHYSYGLSVLHSHLLAGSTVVLTNQSALRPGFFETIATYGVTTLPNVPFGFVVLDRVGFAERDLPSVRVLTQAGGRLPLVTADRYHALMAARSGQLHLMYGQTEATARMSVLHHEEFDGGRGSAGRAIPGGAFEVISPDSSGRGEVRYRGPNVMWGYATDRDGLSAGDECGGVLDTGDAGTLDHGVLTVVGRLGRTAKVLGMRFNLDEVERSAARFGTVAVVEGDDRIEVVAERHTEQQRLDLAKVLARELRLPLAAVRVEAIDRLPRTASGKVAYADLVSER